LCPKTHNAPIRIPLAPPAACAPWARNHCKVVHFGSRSSTRSPPAQAQQNGHIASPYSQVAITSSTPRVNSHIRSLFSSIPVSNVETKHPAGATPLVLNVEYLGFDGSLHSKTVSSRGHSAVSLPCLHLCQVLEFRVSGVGLNSSSWLGGAESRGGLPRVYLVPFRDLGWDRARVNERWIYALLLLDDLVNVSI
jgi:hypothetical protein